MKISARNRLKGKVTEVKKGTIMAKVTIDIGGGNQLTSAILLDSAEDLGLEVGSEVTAVIKSTEIMVQTG